MIVAIDPGTEESGVVVLEGSTVTFAEVRPNPWVLTWLELRGAGATLAIEMIASYGMPVGARVFETCVWIGRFQQAWPQPSEVMRVKKRYVQLHLCQTTRAKDGSLWQVLVDRFGPVGTKKQPGALYGVRAHCRDALALAVTISDYLDAGRFLGELPTEWFGVLTPA